MQAGGQPLVSFVDVPEPARRLLRERFGEPALSRSDEHELPGAPVVVRFGAPPRPRRSVHLATAGTRVAADDDERFYLIDKAGRRAQLPATPADETLLVDPAIDARRGETLDQLAGRLFEWQLARRGMVALKGAAAVVPEGGVGLVGFGGSGKSSVLLTMLARATAYLAEERLVLCGPRTIAACPAPVWLALGRR